jgi:hypothetical protein
MNRRRPLSPTHDLKRSFRSREGAPFVVFLILSLVINGVGAYCGWWFKFPEPPPQKEDTIQLTAFDTNDLEKLGDPNAPEEPPPPEPEPTPPPESEPTPPPLDKPPEFEIPQATPTCRQSRGYSELPAFGKFWLDQRQSDRRAGRNRNWRSSFGPAASESASALPVFSPSDAHIGRCARDDNSSGREHRRGRGFRPPHVGQRRRAMGKGQLEV